MTEHNDVKSNVATSLKIFPVLALLILITVFVHQSHLPYQIQLIIEITKAVIAVWYFTHLISDRKQINTVWGLTIAVVIGLLFLPIMNAHNHITGTVDTSKELQLEQGASPKADAHAHVD